MQFIVFIESFSTIYCNHCSYNRLEKFHDNNIWPKHSGKTSNQNNSSHLSVYSLCFCYIIGYVCG